MSLEEYIHKRTPDQIARNSYYKMHYDEWSYEEDDNVLIEDFSYIILKKPIEDDRLLNILEFFNYTLSYKAYIDNKLCLYIEPTFSEDASEYFGICHRQAYHFTYKENIDKILKSEIRLKQGSCKNFPSRIYLWASQVRRLEDDIYNVNSFIQKIFGSSRYNINNVGIFKVDLFHTKYPIYHDTSMKEKEALFIYNSVPKELCKLIK